MQQFGLYLLLSSQETSVSAMTAMQAARTDHDKLEAICANCMQTRLIRRARWVRVVEGQHTKVWLTDTSWGMLVSRWPPLQHWSMFTDILLPKMIRLLVREFQTCLSCPDSAFLNSAGYCCAYILVLWLLFHYLTSRLFRDPTRWGVGGGGTGCSAN